jgi:antitoxin component of MazEF toxin-antitoxin module
VPIRRKICKIGTGLAVFLPKSWVDLLQEKHGPIEAVTMEVDNVITIAPILKDGSKTAPILSKETQQDDWRHTRNSNHSNR